MLKLHVLTLISVLLLAVVVGCSSSDQAAIDEKIDSALVDARVSIVESISATLIAAHQTDAVPAFTPVPESVPTPTRESVTSNVLFPTPLPTATPGPTPEAVIDPFIPTIFDAQAAFSTDFSDNEDSAEIIHAHFTGRWLLHLLSRNEVGSRKEFQSFAAQGDDFLFGYKLNQAMQQRIDSGDLPDWAHDYFIDPPDEEHALVACTAYFFTPNNPTFWIRFGHGVCWRSMSNWLRDGGTGSWTEWLINIPKP